MRNWLLLFLLISSLAVAFGPQSWFEGFAPSPPSALADDDGERDGERERSARLDRKRTGDGDRSVAGLTSRLGPGLVRGPYLQMATPTAVTIRWRTSEPLPSRVRYGHSPDDLRFLDEMPAATTEHEVRLTALRPDTRYHYAVETTPSGITAASSGSFRTAPPVGSRRKVRIWMIGDSGLRGAAQQRVQQAYDAYSDGADTDVWILLGDNAYTSGTGAQYQAGFFEPYATRLRSTVVWPARGNHDVPREGPANDYYDFFTLPAAAQAGGMPSGTEAWYSFDFGNVHFVCLDAERMGNGGAMLDWLRADLAATRQEWVIAYWHHPPYSKGSHDSDTDELMTQVRRRVLPVLEEGGVDLVACGHSHSYERSFLLDGHHGASSSLETSMVLDRGDGRPNGDGPYRKATDGRAASHEGAVYVVVGSSSKLGGGSLDHRAHVRSLNVLGSLAIDVSGNRLDAAFVDDRARVLDRFSIVKGERPVSLVGDRPAGPRARGGHSTAPSRDERSSER